uniref:Uncharacterized protein n=1 Tax=Timema bartmani TaxID=61472 RepID=A0A7R9ET53_9NEOP|nr:unnamed protein product [Timema bartmani]
MIFLHQVLLPIRVIHLCTNHANLLVMRKVELEDQCGLDKYICVKIQYFIHTIRKIESNTS